MKRTTVTLIGPKAMNMNLRHSSSKATLNGARRISILLFRPAPSLGARTQGKLHQNSPKKNMKLKNSSLFFGNATKNWRAGRN